MPIFTLKFSDDARGPADTIEFEAEDAGRAFAIARNHGEGREAELWCDKTMICIITRQAFGDDDLWIIYGPKGRKR